MPAISGTGARIFFSTSTGAGAGADVEDMTQWTLNIDGGLIDTNAFGSTWRTAIAGLRGAQGSAQGFWNMSTATGDESTAQREMQSELLNGSKGHIQLYTNQAQAEGYEFDAWISGIQVQAQVDGAVGFSVDFTANGAVTYSTALA